MGKSGIERYYNDKLQGTLGFKDTKVNALNKEIEVIEQKDPSNDNNVRITIDVNLQKYIQELFVDRAGSVIVMDANNGEILAAGSFPEYDSNLLQEELLKKSGIL